VGLGAFCGTDCAAALHTGSRFDAASFRTNSPSRLIGLLRTSCPSSARCCHAYANTAGPAALRRSRRLLLRFADPPMSAPARQPASAFRASARRAPHGPAAEDAGPYATAVAGCHLGWMISLSGSCLLTLDTRLFPPLPWPALRGAIQAPGRSKRRPSMSAVPAASCSSFSRNAQRVAASSAFSPSRRYRGFARGGYGPCRAALRCPHQWLMKL